ncbi:esterase/lipase family protein [Pseudonocardia sp. HH130630-07]|uniref:esterase/lipase family protein n=1 Tax=Pseudonocardia sp. HH130630-07 TaxID=1690815 RepID=UPI000814D3F6|nr:alpha/beta hydrolase [Pseudonocardia sp. HH130630-07]ANY05694.1 hypothetical protein AFB00_04555 [Pseudonocardia sp. HH130630-07]
MTPGEPARVVLVHGAWHRGACWAPVAAELERSGAAVAAPDLPSDTPRAGHREYVDAVLAAIGPGTDGPPVVLVAHSLGGLVATVAADRLGPRRVRALVLVGAFLPRPGRAFAEVLRAEPDLLVPGYDAGVRRGEGRTTRWPDAATVAAGLYRGVADELAAGAAGAVAGPAATVAGPAGTAVAPAGAVAGPAAAVALAADADAVVAGAAGGLRAQDWTLLTEPCPLAAWPRVRTVAVVCAGDRVVAPAAGRRAAGGIGPGVAEVVELPGGHFPMLTRPVELAGLIAGLATDGAAPGSP